MYMARKWLYLSDNCPLRNVQEVFRIRDQPHPTRLAANYRNGSDLWLDDKKKKKLISYILTLCSWVMLTGCLEAEISMWKHQCVKKEMATYITKRRQSLSCSARSFSDIPAMKKSSAAKLHWQNSFSQFRRTTREWSHSCISLLTGMAPTHAYINFFFVLAK